MRIARVMLIVAALALVASACAPAAPAAPAASAKMTFAMVTDVNGLGDGGFNDMAWAGLQKAEQELGSKPKVVESRENSQYVPNLTSLAEAKADLIVGVGYMLTDAVAEIAAKYPDLHFALVDSVVDAPNVVNLVFKEQDGSFLMGAVAGLMTKSNIVGFVGGEEGVLIKKFEVGYRAGVKTTNPDCQVLVSYVGSFADPPGGEDTANAVYDQGADIIYVAAGQTNLGAFNAAKKRGADAKVIGVDSDQYPLAPDNVISSMIKRIDTAVFETCQMVKDDTFEGTTKVYGIAEGGIDISPSSEKTLPKDVLDAALKLKERVKNGEFTPPSTEDEYEAFTPPSL